MPQTALPKLFLSAFLTSVKDHPRLLVARAKTGAIPDPTLQQAPSDLSQILLFLLKKKSIASPASFLHSSVATLGLTTVPFRLIVCNNLTSRPVSSLLPFGLFSTLQLECFCCGQILTLLHPKGSKDFPCHLTSIVPQSPTPPAMPCFPSL